MAWTLTFTTTNPLGLQITDVVTGTGSRSCTSHEKQARSWFASHNYALVSIVLHIG
jgi:hypothetical protein